MFMCHGNTYSSLNGFACYRKACIRLHSLAFESSSKPCRSPDLHSRISCFIESAKAKDFGNLDTEEIASEGAEVHGRILNLLFQRRSSPGRACKTQGASSHASSQSVRSFSLNCPLKGLTSHSVHTIEQASIPGPKCTPWLNKQMGLFPNLSL